MKFRFHRGLLADSMTTVVEIPPTIEALCDLLAAEFRCFPSTPKIGGHVHVEAYAYDRRIDWHTYIVTLDGYGVVGFTDGRLQEAKESAG